MFSRRLVIIGGRMFGCSASVRANVGFIGLGNMGGPMAANLAKAGHSLTVYDVQEAAVEKLKSSEHGSAVQGAPSPADVARRATDCLVTMLPSTPHVQAVYADVIPVAAEHNALLIDASTIEPGAAKSVAERAHQAGLDMVDAPVSGGVPAAQAGSLTFMVGGTDKAFARAEPFLNAMGANVFHCGGPGNGQVVKVCNNLVLAISMMGTAEGMNLGIQLGMDAKKLGEIFATTTARSWSMDTYNPAPGVLEGVPASRDYEGGFASALMAKDLSLAMTAAHNAKVPLPLGGSAAQFYNLMCAQGLGAKDFGVVYKFLAEQKNPQ